MIKLYIGIQPAVDSSTFTHSSLQLADLNKDEAVVLTTQINDFESISGSLAPHTLQFTIPASDTNNTILQNYSQIDISSSINPHRAVDAKLVLGDMLEILGGLEVKGYSWEGGKPKDYKVVFYGQEFSIKNLLSKQLNQIDWSDFDYDLTYENMKSSWDSDLADGNGVKGNILLPVMSHVRDYLYQPDISIGQNHPNNIANNEPYYAEGDGDSENPIEPGIRLDELKTALKLKTMVENIYDDIGVSVTWGTIIAAYLSNVFVIPSKEAGAAKNETVSQTGDVCVVKYDAAAYQSLAIDPTWTTISMPTIIQDSGDPTPLWSSDTTFTAQTTGIFRFELVYRDPNTNICNKGGDAPRSQQVRFRAYRNGATVFDAVTEYVECYIKRVVYFEGYLDNGDTLVFQGQTDATTAMEYKFYQLTMVFSPTTFYGNTTATADNMPEMTAWEFIKGFLATFNLIQIIELTEMGGDLTVQSVKLIDKDEFYTGGTVRDWTKYVSIGKRVYDKPQIDKDLILKYAETEDKVNIAFFREALRNYAQLNYVSDADFTGKDLDNTSIFSTFPPSFINKLDGYGQPEGTTDLLIHSQFDNEGKPINSDFLIFMYNGEEGVGNTYFIQSGVDANGQPTFGSAEDSLPYCTSHAAYPCEQDSYSLNYSEENPASGDVSLNTSAKIFFNNYLKNLYSASAKILTVDAVIPLSELNVFTLDDTIEIQGIRYVVDTLKRNLLTNVSKLKLITYNADIVYTKPTSYLNSGEVVFDATPTNNELTTYNTQLNNRTNINEGQLYLWKSYRVSIKRQALVTQADKNFRLLPKAEGQADATSGAFTINTTTTNVLTIYDTVNTQIKLWFNGTPTAVTTGRITVYEAGRYQFSTTVNFSLATLAQQVKFVLAINGTNYFLNPIVAANQSAAWELIMNCTIPLSIGDYIELYCYGDISQAYTINSGSTNLIRI
jgi:hypothetical protein